MLKVVHEESESNAHAPVGVGGSLLDGLVRDGARAMLAAALQAEVAAYIDAHAGEVDEAGYRLVVRNGYHQPREVATAAGAVPVRAPRVNDRRLDEASGQRQRFSSAILPAWARKSPQVAEVLPLLYLHGLSSGDFVPALEQFLGSAAGLSRAATVTRLTAQWQGEAAAFNQRSSFGARAGAMTAEKSLSRCGAGGGSGDRLRPLLDVRGGASDPPSGRRCAMAALLIGYARVSTDQQDLTA